MNTRVAKQRQDVLAVMSDGKWHTLIELDEKVEGLTTAISARVRELRNPTFGGYEIVTRRVTPSLYEYRMVK